MTPHESLPVSVRGHNMSNMALAVMPLDAEKWLPEVETDRRLFLARCHDRMIAKGFTNDEADGALETLGTIVALVALTRREPMPDLIEFLFERMLNMNDRSGFARGFRRSAKADIMIDFIFHNFALAEVADAVGVEMPDGA